MIAQPDVLERVIEEAGVLTNNNRLIESFRTAMSSGKHAFDTVPPIVDEIIDENAWMDFIDRAHGRQSFGSEEFRKFIEEQPPRGIGSTVEEVRKYLGGSEDPIRVKYEALVDRGRGNPTGRQNAPRQADGTFTSIPNVIRDTGMGEPPVIPLRGAEQDPPAPAPRHRDRSREPQAGTSVGYAVRRLGRAAEEEPERFRPIYERLMRGETTANSAMVEAGFRPKAITIDFEPVAAARRLVKHFRGESLRTLVRELANWAGITIVETPDE